MYAKLKDDLAVNVGTTIMLLERLGQVDGKFGPQYKYKLSNLANQKHYDHYASANEEASLSSFAQGETLMVYKRQGNKPGMTYLEWVPLDGAEARLAANPPVRTNTSQSKADKDYEERQKEQEEKSIAISLQGFMQQIIPVLRQKSSAPDEMLIDEALALAVRAREACLRQAKLIHLGIPSAPVLKTKLEEAEAIFGSERNP